MKHFARLVARGYWGQPSPPPFTYDLTCHKYFEAARRGRGLVNLVRLRGLQDASEETTNDSGAAIALKSRLVFPASWNAKAVWSGSASTYLTQLPNLFGGNKPGVAYERSQLNTPVSFTSSFAVAKNQGIALRAFLFEPAKAENDEPQPRAIWFAGWDKWLFRIVNGSFEIARKSANWSQGNQDTLDALLDVEEPTSEQQQQIDDLVGPRKVEPGGTVTFPNAIYDIYQSVSLGSAKKEDAGEFYEISFQPEPRGRLNITLAGADTQGIEIPDILSTRTTGTVWNASAITIGSNGQAFMWQTGYFAHSPNGSWMVGPFKNGYWTEDIDTANLLAAADTSFEGTDVTIERIDHDSVWFSFKITLSTTDSRYTPFLYAAQANLAGGPRNGSTAVSWDSNAHLDSAGNPPIEEIEPSQDGVMRRQQFTVKIRDPKGSVLGGIANDLRYEALENRVVDLSIGTSVKQIPVLTTGIVKRVTLNEMGPIRRALSRVFACLDNTTVTLTICDVWDILDEDLMQDAPIGDGMKLGAYLRLILGNAGFTDDELAGIDATDGITLDSAALGEEPCVKPGNDQSRGDFLRTLIEEHGLGWILYFDNNGVWQFAPRQTAIKTVRIYSSAEAYSEHQAEFSSEAARNHSETYPGRFAALSLVDHIRDFVDSFSHFRVEGWIDPATGQRLAQEWTIHEAIKRTAESVATNFMGRLKRYGTRRNEGLRTANAVQRALRSLVLLFGRSGRFYQFDTYFLPFFFVGDVISLDDVTCEITGISGGSLANDSMQMVVQEL